MRSNQQAVISSGTSLSSAVDLGLTGTLCALVTDAAWTTNELEVQGSLDNITYFPVYTSGMAKLEVAAAVASRMYVFNPATTRSFRWVKVLSTALGVPANQAADTTLTVVSSSA